MTRLSFLPICVHKTDNFLFSMFFPHFNQYKNCLKIYLLFLNFCFFFIFIFYYYFIKNKKEEGRLIITFPLELCFFIMRWNIFSIFCFISFYRLVFNAILTNFTMFVFHVYLFLLSSLPCYTIAINDFGINDI